MVLQGNTTHFLVVSDVIETAVEVGFFEKFDDAKGHFADHFRISPIFPLNQSKIPKLDDFQKSYLVFFGPIYPGKIDIDGNPELYITLGTFNIVAWCSSQKKYRSTLKFIKQNSLPYEVWELRGVELTNCIEQYHFMPPDSFKVPDDIITTAKDISVSAREYMLLIQKGLRLSQKYDEHATKYLLDFDKAFKSLLKRPYYSSSQTKLTTLVLANAALSRFINQTYTGTSYIQRNECHYSPHSLLGIGTATTSLRSLYSHISNRLIKEEFIERIRATEKISLPRHDDLPIFSRSSSDAFFLQDILYNVEVENAVEKLNPEISIPAICCFSGKDGFRSTPVSLSAPLESISNSNLYSWSLVTLTHEITHIYIGAVLGLFIKDLNSNSEYWAQLLIDHKNNKPKNYFELGIQCLLFGYQRIYHAEHKKAMKPSPDGGPSTSSIAQELPEYIKKCNPEVNEILTHIFDYLYFYKRNSDRYIYSLWASWSTVPDIETRIPSYIIRTLTALYSWDMGPIELTVEKFKKQLRTLLDKKLLSPQARHIVSFAIAEIDKDIDYYCAALTDRVPLAKFSRAFLFSERLAMKLSGSQNSNLKPLQYGTEAPTNPLDFLETNSKDWQFNMGKSIWMLQNIAFGGGSN